MTLEIRQATTADKSAIEAFIVSTYEGLASHKGPIRWAWQFEQNPYVDASADQRPVWIAVDDGAVVGQIAVQMAEFKIGERSRPGGWIVDVMIGASHRGLGLGHKLYTAAAKDLDLLITLTMAPATRKMAERLDAISLSPTRHYSRWERVTAKDVRRYVAQRTEHRPQLAAIGNFCCRSLAFDHLGALVAACLVAVRPEGRVPVAKDVEVSEIARFGHDIDQLWRRVAGQHQALAVRDSAFLNWRFADCPALEYRRFVAQRDGQTVGYSVLRATAPTELRQGVIVDLFAAPEDTEALTTLLAHALEFFRGGVASIECGTSSPQVSAALQKAGFHCVRTHIPTAVVTCDELRTEIERTKDGWFLSKADHDWDQIHLA